MNVYSLAGAYWVNVYSGAWANDCMYSALAV